MASGGLNQPPPQSPPPVYRNPAPGYPAETVKFVFPNMWITTSGIAETYTLIVTERRSIFARRTPQVMNETIREARAKTEAEGKGFFGKWAAQLNGGNDYAVHYNKLTPDRILQETSGNFTIENTAIRKIRLTVNGGEDNPDTDYGIDFQTTSGELKFKASHYYEINLKLAYGNAIISTK
jgi:hypothetical protein